MATNQPRDHHYTPQFFLRNFAVDPEKKKINTVAKRGSHAVWAQRSIAGVGFERDLYVHLQNGTPVSVESRINEKVETPISKSDTWAKIVSGRTDALDRSDKAILYALIRHLEVRTPHYLATARELTEHAASSDSGIPFAEEEFEMYAFLRANPNHESIMFNMMSTSLDWTEESFAGAGLSIFRSPIPLRSSTIPVLAIGAPEYPASRLPLPGTVPYQLVLTLNRNTIATLVLADFDDAFINSEIDVVVARAFNRRFACQFSYFEKVRHLITDKGDDLITDMTWAPYDLVKKTERKIIFRRRET
ncbi:MAG: DUF4238 domain-containing protein [Xanthobacteraceae bacterium]